MSNLVESEFDPLVRHSVSWFSAGVSSAVATRLAIDEIDEVFYIHIDDQHPDTLRFVRECEAWFGKPITILQSPYKCVANAVKGAGGRGYVNGPGGAACTRFLKKRVRKEWEYNRKDEMRLRYVWGMDSTEKHRAERIEETMRDFDHSFPLIERGIGKAEAHEILRASGIKRPAMYELAYHNNNCFSGDTEFITDGGIRSLAECEGQSVRVLGAGGVWTDATIHSFGEQPLLCLTIRRYGIRREIYTTAGHRWFTKHGMSGRDETTTVGLKSGDRLASVYGRLGPRVRPSAFGIAQGIVFGDGTRGTTLNTACVLTLCGAKDRELLHYFPLSPRAEVPAGIQVRDLPRFWKGVPRQDDCQSFLYGWLAGYFAADGCVTDGECILASADRGHLEFAKNVAIRLGIGTGRIRCSMRRGFGSEPTALYSLPLIGNTLRDDFFVLSKHRERYASKATREAGRSWVVEDVKPTGRVEDVYCAVVPDGQAFALEGNILTGNCVGCVKGGMGYWNKIRVDFPEVFAARAKLEREVGASCIKGVFLDELDPERGRHGGPICDDCGIQCELLSLSMVALRI